MATLNDVARAAGVDASTASRVLRNDPDQVVREETRIRIFAVAKELSYRPSLIARALRTQRTNTIALVTPRLADFAFSDILRGIQSEAIDRERMLVVVEWDALRGDAAKEREVMSHLMRDGMIDGLLIAFAKYGDAHMAEWASGPIPMVTVNGRVEGFRGSVISDDEGAARVAVQHLIDLGHSRIGFVGLPAGRSTTEGRYEGFESAMADAGLYVNANWVATAEPVLIGGRDAIREIVHRSDPEPPTGVVVAGLRPAVSVLSELPALGVDVPEGMSVIAIGEDEIAEVTRPRLTTVRLPFEAMGRESVRMLLAAIDGEPPEDVRVPDEPRLVLRSSTASVRAYGTVEVR